MPPISSLLSSALLIILSLKAVAVSAAGDEYTYTQASCATFDGTKIYANPEGKCTCGTPADAPAAFIQCPPPGGEAKYALAACTQAVDGRSSRCVKTCTSDAELAADGTCKPINVAPGVPMRETTAANCTIPGYGMIIARAQGCGCDRPENPSPAGTPCKTAPANAVPMCRSAGNVGAGLCTFKCNTGYKKNADNTGCVTDATPPPIDGPGGSTPIPGPEPVVCPPFMDTTVIKADGTCACSDDMDEPSFAGSTVCSKPPSNGQAVCTTTNGQGKCGVKCNAGFKPDAAGKNCVSSGTDQTFTNSKCSANPPGNFYLTAVAEQGCQCLAAPPTAPGQTWCKAPSISGAKASCFQSSDLSVVECRATNCPTGTQAQGNDCVATTINKTTRDCPTDKRFLVVSDTAGCECVGQEDIADGVIACYAPKSTKGVGRCTANADGTGGKCITKLCDSGFNLVNNDCVAS